MIGRRKPYSFSKRSSYSARKQPFFFDESDVFAPPDWKPSIQRGKTYDLNGEAGKYIWRKVENILARKKFFEMDKEYGLQTADPSSARYGKEILIKPRLGQSIFKAVVTDAYNRACAMTNERALPVLEAAHIKPYAKSGPLRATTDSFSAAICTGSSITGT